MRTVLSSDAEKICKLSGAQHTDLPVIANTQIHTQITNTHTHTHTHAYTQTHAHTNTQTHAVTKSANGGRSKMLLY